MVSRQDSFISVDSFQANSETSALDIVDSSQDLNEEPILSSTSSTTNSRSLADPHFKYVNLRWQCEYCLHTSTFLKHLRSKHIEKLESSPSFNDELKKFIIKIRASPQRRQNFEQQCINIGLKPLQLISDNATRWNSTSMMIERALNLKQTIKNTILVDKELEIYRILEDEWKYLQEILNLMQHFKKGTKYVEGQLYPTLTHSVPVYNYLINKLEKIIDQSTELVIINAADAAKSKILEYYPFTDGYVYTIATRIELEHIIELAMNKLIGGQFFSIWKKEVQIKILDTLAILGPCLYIKIAPQSGYVSDLIANNMRLCISVIEDCKYFVISMPTEPVLAEASARIINDPKISLTELINKLSKALKKGIVEAEFLKSLLADNVYEKIKNRLEETVKFTGRKFSEAYIKFTHFINITYIPDKKDLRDALIRGIAYSCKRNQRGAGIIIPLYMGTLDEKFNEDRISYILIQVKNHSTNNRGYGYKKFATSCLSPAYIGIEDLLYMPFLSLYLQLGAKSELTDIPSKFTTTCKIDLCKRKIAKVLENYKMDAKGTEKEFIKKIRLGKEDSDTSRQSTPVPTTSPSTKVNDLTNSLKHLLSAWVDPVMGESQETMEIVKRMTPK
ncbi:12399_t:CDS:2, partial [Dentiscutata heterogama]